MHTQANSDDTPRPGDYVGSGTVRTMEIKGDDINPSCGIHVLSTSHLSDQVRSDNTRLFFLVGQGVTGHAAQWITIGFNRIFCG